MEMPWDTGALSRPPRVYDAPGFSAPGVRALFYEGVPYRGRPTRVFAWYGAPEGKGGERFPAMVLIHGGGGTAMAEWVALWNARGYAAIAMDCCGSVPRSRGLCQERFPHEWAGPAGWNASLEQTGEPVADQWTYHAVAAVVLAHSLIRSFPEVDAERVGVTGISWGGYTTAIVAGVDARFKFAVPVYGCGFLGDNSTWLPDFERIGPERSARWLGLWDPSVYLPRATMPILWVTGTNDFAYPMDSLQKSYRRPRGERVLSIGVRLPHGHEEGWTPPEIAAFADERLKGGLPLPRITAQGREGRAAWAQFRAHTPYVRAEIAWTKDLGAWQERRWESDCGSVTLRLCDGGGRVEAEVPQGASVYYMNVFDARGVRVSAEHEELAD